MTSCLYHLYVGAKTYISALFQSKVRKYHECGPDVRSPQLSAKCPQNICRQVNANNNWRYEVTLNFILEYVSLGPRVPKSVVYLFCICSISLQWLHDVIVKKSIFLIKTQCFIYQTLLNSKLIKNRNRSYI